LAGKTGEEARCLDPKVGHLWEQPIKGLSNPEASLYPNPVNAL